MERKTNYGKIIAVTIAVVAAFTAMAFVVYKLFVKDLAKVYAHQDECDELFLEDEEDCACHECIEPDTTVDAE